MADAPSTSGAGRVIDSSLQTAKDELKKQVKRLLIQNLKKRDDVGRDEAENRLVLLASDRVALADDISDGKNLLSADAQIARYLRERGYEYTLAVLMAEANVPDSHVLKSIAGRLTDTRSRLVSGNPEFQAAVLQLWEEIENRYNKKLRNYVTDWELKQTMQLKQMERILRQRLIDEEQEIKRQLSNQVAAIEAKEKEVMRTVHEKASAFEQRMEQDKRQLLEDASELDQKRQGLQSLETDFRRQIDAEHDRIRRVKDGLNQLSLELKRQQMQLTFQMDEAVKEARQQEQIRFAEKLRQISAKEAKIRDIIEKAKINKDEAGALKRMLHERDNKIQELEMSVQHYKEELIKFQERLRERDETLSGVSDYNILKADNLRVKDEARVIRGRLLQEKQLLQQKNYELEAQCRELKAEVDEWRLRNGSPLKQELTRLELEFEKAKTEWTSKESNYEKQLEEERATNAYLKRKLDDQTGRLENLAETVKKLHFQMAKGRFLSGNVYVDRKSVRTGGVGRSMSMDLEEISDVDEDEPTPDYLKEAKRRLKLLERETETFEESLQRYQQKSIDSSSIALWRSQAVSSARRVPSEEQSEIRNASVNRLSNDAPPVVVDRARQTLVASAQDRFEGVARVSSEVAHGQRQSQDGHLQVSQRVPDVDDARDDWVTKLKRREDERRLRDEELKKRQEQTHISTRENEKEIPSSAGAKAQSLSATEKGPAVDPVLQKYMQMVLEQRQKDKESENVNVTSNTLPSSRPAVEQALGSNAVESSVQQPEVDVAAAKQTSSDSDFEW